MKDFSELGISAPILSAIEEMGFRYPMPVQEECIPYLLENRGDVVALAQTGTGKTAAYGLPSIQLTDVNSRYPQVLILCPTRELCLQITTDLSDFSKHIDGIHIIPMYGGTSIENQIRNFKRGAHIIVATPGRLLDLMNRGVVHLETISTLILDEADEMLDMGFSEDLDAIVSAIPSTRRTMMFSATMSKEISVIAEKYLKDAHYIQIGTRNEGAANVNHIYYMVHAQDRYLALKRIVDYYPDIYAIIFCRTRLETQDIADKLMQDGYNAEPLHGELSQAQRDLTMNKFRRRQLQLLVATDVAARGLDVDDLTHVINYGLPDDTENYTHRSGRTGRAGKTGTSISILNLREKYKIRTIEKSIGKKFTEGTIPDGSQICVKQLYKVMDEIERTLVNEEQIAPFLPAILRKLDWLDKEDIIKRIITREFGRFMEYYSNAPQLQDIASDRSKADADKRKKDKRRPQAGYVRMFISVGKRDNIQPIHIMDMINKRSHGERVDIGRIDLMYNFSFFEIPEESVDRVLDILADARFHGRPVTVQRADKDNGGSDDSKPSRSKKKTEDDNLDWFHPDDGFKTVRKGRSSDRKEKKRKKEKKETTGKKERRSSGKKKESKTKGKPKRSARQ